LYYLIEGMCLFYFFLLSLLFVFKISVITIYLYIDVKNNNESNITSELILGLKLEEQELQDASNYLLLA
jgi:hypothetical protein